MMDNQSKGSKAFGAFKRSKKSAAPKDSQEERWTEQDSPHHKPRHKKSLASLGRLFHFNQSQSSQNQPGQPGLSSRDTHQHSLQTGRYQSLSPKSSYQQLRRSPKEGFGLPEDDRDYQDDSEDECGPGDKDEPEPTVLGSVDYHNFLCGTSGRKTKITLSSISPTQPDASTPKQGFNLDARHLDSGAPQTVIRTKPSKKALVLVPSDKIPLQNPWTKQSLPLRERRSQRLVEQFATSDLPQFTVPIRLRQPSKQSLNSSQSHSERLAEQITFIGTPKTGSNLQLTSLKGSVTTPSTTRPASPGPAQLALMPTPMDKGSFSGQSISLPELPPTPGPAGSISSKEIDPEKLQPFIGPLLPQLPPPNRPLPHPPSITMQRLQKNAVRGDSADVTESKTDGVGEFSLSPPTQDPLHPTTPAKQRLFSIGSKGSKGKGSIDIDEDREDSMEQMSENTMRHGLRNKVSKLFGDAPAPPRPADISNTTASGSIYRPISLNSHKADEISFSGIFDDVYNASRNSVAGSLPSATAMSILSQDLTGDLSAIDSRDCRGLSGYSGHDRIDVTSQISAVASSISGCPSMIQEAPDTRQPSQRRKESISLASAPSREDVAASLASRLGLTDSASREAILEAFTAVAPPPLVQHPAIRGDLALQARGGMIDDSTTALLPPITASTQVVTINPISGMHVPPLNVRRQRPTQVAVSTRNACRSAPAVDPLTGFTSRSLVLVPDVNAGKDPEDDVDPCPAFDRSVDLTWYRFSRRTGRQNHRQSFLPTPNNMFYHVNSYFIAKCARGRPTNKYDHLTKRFRYFDLKASLRFKIMEKLLEDHLPGKPILLNRKVQASPAWSDDEFASLWDLLGPLQNYLQADPRTRADVMTALLMKQPFHVIFSPFVKGETQPLPTKWLFRYLYFMQDVRVELDMTKLGFGPRWEATALTTRLQHIGNLVWVFVDEMLKRDPQCNPLGRLTIHCRRFFGYRQGKNPFQGDKEFYNYPLIGGEDQGKPSPATEGQPWNYGRRAPSLPPSVNNPYSGHRRHHGFATDRVPYVHESHMSVADPFLKLTGRVWSVRFCGMSENWVKDNYFRFWPQKEHEDIPPPELHVHIDRYLPSRHAYAAPGHAVFFDYGLRAGIHRFPPLPDSEAMVCTDFDQDNDCFVEVGSGNILTVMENGVEVIARSLCPPIPRSELPFPGGPAVPLSGVASSRISDPVDGTGSSTMQATRNGTPQKAFQLLGIQGASSSSGSAAIPSVCHPADGEEDSLLSPALPRCSSSAASRRQRSQSMGGNDAQLGDMTSLHRRLSSVNNAARPLALSTKKSFLSLMGADRRKVAK